MFSAAYFSETKVMSRGIVVLLGPPGAGKGTQAKHLFAEFNMPQISTGELLRSHMARHTVLGAKARRCADGGLLVADDLVCGIVEERLAEQDCGRGAVLDGFPRTVCQAEWLNRYLYSQDSVKSFSRQIPFIVIKINMQENELFRRLTGRRVCPSCGRAYNVFSGSVGKPNVCEFDGVDLICRQDDAHDIIYDRIKIYEQETLPVAQYYRDKGLLREIEGSRSSDAVFSEIVQILEEVHPTHRKQLHYQALVRSY